MIDLRRCDSCNKKFSDEQFFCLQCGMPTEEVITDYNHNDNFRIKDIPYPIVIEFIAYFFYVLIISPKLIISYEVVISIRILFLIIVILTLIILLRRDYGKIYQSKLNHNRFDLSYFIFHSQHLYLFFIFILQIYLYLFFNPIFWNALLLFIFFLFIYNILKNMICKQESDIINKFNKMELFRTLYIAIATIGFAIFFALAVTFGGSAVGDAYASLRYEDYEVGKYYLTRHGRFTPVSYTIWIRMKVLEQVTFSLLVVAMLLNFIYHSKTKGIKYILTDRSINHDKSNSKSTLIDKIAFSIFFAFIVFVCAYILIILF